MLRIALTLAFITATGAAEAAAYKCTAPDGSLTFSDKPCPEEETERVELREEGRVPDRDAAEALAGQQRMAEEFERRRERSIQSNLNRRSGAVSSKQSEDAERERIRSAKIHDRIVEGMSADDVEQVMGSPTRINRSSSGDQWVYDHGGPTTYVYVRGGKVTSWQRYGTRPD